MIVLFALQIWIAGESVADYRYNSKSCHYREKYLDTGDRGFFFQGELYICGREKDILIIRGRNIDPAPLEQVVSEMAEIRSGCVAIFPLRDEAKGEEFPTLVAELKNSQRMENVDVTELKSKIHNLILEKFQIHLGQILLVESGSLPRTSSGKIQRRMCRQIFLQGSINRGPGRARFKALMAIIRGKFYQWYTELFR